MNLADLVLSGRCSADEARDPTFERRPGLAGELFDLCDVRPEDAFIVVSNSGRNSSIIDMALIATERKFPLVR